MDNAGDGAPNTVGARTERATRLSLLMAPRFVLEGVGGATQCRFVVNDPAGNEFVRIRWSEAETFCKQLRKEYPQLPKELALPKYYMSTKKPTELEVKRQHIATLFEGLAKWAAENNEPTTAKVQSLLSKVAGPSGQSVSTSVSLNRESDSHTAENGGCEG